MKFKFEVGKYYKNNECHMRICGTVQSIYKGIVFIGEQNNGLVKMYNIDESATIGWQEIPKEDFYANMF